LKAELEVGFELPMGSKVKKDWKPKTLRKKFETNIQT
jgi:hypothetical protein